MGLGGRRKDVFLAISFLFLITVIANQNVIAVYGALSPLPPTIEVTPNHVSLGEEVKLTVKVLVNEKSKVTLSVPQIMGDGDATLLYKQPETTPEPEPIAPDAYFARSSSTIKEKDLVSFDASGSTDSDGTITNYTWDFGDGTSGQGETSSHNYSIASVYTITLTVTDNDSQTDSYSREVTVVVPDSGTATEPNPDPVENSESEPTTETTTLPLKKGEVATFTWTFNATKGGNIYFTTKMTVTQEETVTLSQDLSSKEVGVSSFPITSLLGFTIVSFFILLSSFFNTEKPRISWTSLFGGQEGIIFILLTFGISVAAGAIPIYIHLAENWQLIGLVIMGSFSILLGIIACYGKFGISPINEFTASILVASGITPFLFFTGARLELLFILAIIAMAIYTEYLEMNNRNDD